MNSNKTFDDVIVNRFSCRNFTAERITTEELNYILEAGRLAPTAKNKQPERIIVIENEGLLERLKEATPCTFDAKTVLVVCYDKNECWIRKTDSKYHGEIDATIAATNMMLATYAINLGTTFVCAFDNDILKSILDIPSNIEPVCLLPIGYPKEIKPHNTRVELEDLVIYK